MDSKRYLCQQFAVHFEWNKLGCILPKLIILHAGKHREIRSSSQVIIFCMTAKGLSEYVLHVFSKLILF